MGVELFKKYVSSSMMICYRSLVRHPFLVGMVFLLIWMHRVFPLFFSFLVSSSPVIVSTAVLLGTLLSFGQPNIPEIEKEPKSEQFEIQKLESKVTSQTEIVGRDGNFASEETNGSRIEVVDKSFEVINPINEDNSCLEVDKPLDLVDDDELVTEVKSREFGEEHLEDEAQNETDEVKVVLGSHYSPLKQSEDEHIVLESDDKLWEGSADPLNSDPALLWKRVEGDDYDDDEDDDDDDDGSDSDLAESSSPDASMADIIPMLDELHPLLSEEREIRQEHNDEDDIENHEDSDHSLESSESSSESNDEDGVKTHEDLEAGDEEDTESKHTDKEDEPKSLITWTEDDQKNLMNLGTSELERNRHLENLIARRRAQKNHENLEAGDEEDEDEDKESKHTDKEDEPRSVITWTEDDQKNLMNLGTSELERNRYLENLIERRRAQKTHENLEAGDEEDEDEDKESKHTDKEDEPRSAITWTEDDQKNLMNLGTSELERNRRLENLIARRRARKTMRMQAENNLIDLESADLPWNIPPISTARTNPFDYDSHDNIPGSAPSVLLKRRNPFDLPYDSSEEKPDLVGDTFQQEFAGFQPKESFFRRHESFNVGPSNFGGLRSERQETKLRPYFVPERVFQRQFSGISDSKASSVPDTESVSSADDLENKDHEDEVSLEPEVGSEKDQEHEELISESHERPYFVPEHVSSVAYERQLSEVSDSKLSSVPDTESVSSAGDLENKGHTEDELSLEPEVVSEKDEENEELISERHERPYFVPEHVDSVAFERQSSAVSDSKLSSIPDTESVSSADDLENKDHIDLSQEPELISFEDDDDNVESVQVPEGDERLDEAEIIVANVTNQQVVNVNAASSMDEVHSNASSSYEASEQIYNEKEDDEVATSISETNYFEDNGSLIERSEIDVTSLSVEVSQPKEPVYDMSPRSVTRNLSSSSICNDLQAEVSDRVQSLPEGTSSVSERESEETVSKMEMDCPEADDIGSRSIKDHDLNELKPNLVEDHLHKDESFQHTDDQNQSSSSPDVVLDMDASHSQQLQQVQELEHNEVISSNGEPLFAEFPLLEDTSANQPLEENLDLLQEQIASNDLENLQIQEPRDDISVSNNSVLNAEPDVVEVVGTEDIHNSIIDDVDEINEFDEDLLVELDAVGDFSVNDLASTSNDMEEDPHVLETKHSADEDSCSKDLGSVLNEIEHHPEHVLETEHSGDVDSYSKDLGSTLNEMEEGPHALDHDLETKPSADEDSHSKDLGSTLNEMEEGPHALDHDLETKPSADEDSHSKDLGLEQDPHSLELDLETQHSGDKHSYSKDIGATLEEMKEDPHGLKHDIEAKHSGDEASSINDLGSSLDEMKQDPQGLEHDLEIKLSGDEDSYSEAIYEMKQNPHDLDHDLEDSYSKDLESTLNETGGGHGLETFYSVDEYAFSKIVESTLNEMKYEPQVLDHVLETNPSADEDLLTTQVKMDENKVTDSQNEKESSNIEVEAEAIKTKLINDTNEEALPQETESNSTSATMVNHGTENSSSTSNNTDKE